jgi:hypothetical protein
MMRIIDKLQILALWRPNALCLVERVLDGLLRERSADGA